MNETNGVTLQAQYFVDLNYIEKNQILGQLTYTLDYTNNTQLFSALDYTNNTQLFSALDYTNNTQLKHF